MDTCLERIKPATDWNSVVWRKAERNVRRLRGRIFRAEKAGDGRKVRLLQKLMLRSHSNRLDAVRKVTQINKGKNTPGVDRITVKTPGARGRLVDTLNFKSEAVPVKRVYIPKANGKRRPLGIPVIRERAEQAMIKNALEPQWEARFEWCSYGFRPGRGCHDALRLIYIRVVGSTMPWVIDADIEGAFDELDQDFVMKAISEFPGKEKIRQWLKAGVMEGWQFEPADSGTPQGGVISPLLMNIALHGMERILPYGRLVRYADDFIVFAKSESEANAMKEMVSHWLSKRGLKFSESKTRIRNVHDGFEFLGCHIKRYYTPGTRWRDRNRFFDSPREGYKVLTKPSRNSTKRFREKLREKVRQLNGANQKALIAQLNPIVKGWANYFKPFISKQIFTSMDDYIWKMLWRWGRRKHNNKCNTWIAARYWGNFAKGHNDRWVFGYLNSKGASKYLYKMKWAPIKRHNMVKGDFSKDDPSLVEYWTKRRIRLTRDGLLPYQKTLIITQKGICPWCGCEIDNGERVEIDHKIPLYAGGSDHISNKQLLHYYCHQQKTNNDRNLHAPGQKGELFER